MNYADLKATSLRLSDTTATGIPELVLTSGLASLYNGTNRIHITPTNVSSDGVLTLSNTTFSGTTTGFTMPSTDNSSKIATTAFVKAQTPIGYARLESNQSWTAAQNFSTITASTPATSDNSSTVATTAFVKAQPSLTLPIVLGSTGVLTTLGQSITYLVTNQTINSTTRGYAPSGLLVPGTYTVDMNIYATPATYTSAVLQLGSSTSPLTNAQSSGLDLSVYAFSASSVGGIDDNTCYRELGNKTITNGLLNMNVFTVLNIVSAGPYICVCSNISGSTTAASISLKITRIA